MRLHRVQLPCSRITASSPTPQSEGWQEVQLSKTYVGERIANEGLDAVLDASQPNRCFCRFRPNIGILRGSLSNDIPTHSFRYHEREMAVCRTRRVVLWQIAEEKLTQHPSKRTVVLVGLAIVISPDSQVGCYIVVLSRASSDTYTDLRTGELCRHEAIPPRETNSIGENRPRNRVPGAQPGPRHRDLGFLSLEANL